MADNPQTEIEVADNSAPTLATSALQSTGNSSLSSIDTKLNSQATAANQSTLNTRVGDLTESAPGTDTASSGLNGRLQRIAQRITSMITTLTDGTQQTRLRGGSDGTIIGNTSDSLKVVFTEIKPKTFVARASDVKIGNAKSMLSLVNASGSAVKIRIREIWIKNVQTSSLTGVVAEFQLNKIVNHSAGSTVTPTSFDSSDSLNGSVTARTGGTVTSEGATYSRWLWSSDEWGPGPQDNETNEHTAHNTIPHYRDQGRWKPITLNANEGVHIKQLTNSTNGTFDIEIVFTEENS